MFPVILQHCPLILPPVALLITDTAAEKQEPTILKYPLWEIRTEKMLLNCDHVQKKDVKNDFFNVLQAQK